MPFDPSGVQAPGSGVSKSKPAGGGFDPSTVAGGGSTFDPVGAFAGSNAPRPSVPLPPDQSEKYGEMSKLSKITDLMGRPGYALKAMWRDEMDLKDEVYESLGYSHIKSPIDYFNLPTEERNTINEAMAAQGPRFKEKGEAAWRGLTGQQRDTWNELYGRSGIKNIPFLGFVTEVATDPLYVAGVYDDIFRVGGRALKMTNNTLRKLSWVDEAEKLLVSKWGSATKGLRDLFVNKSGIAKISDLANKYLSKRGRMYGEAERYSAKVSRVISNTAAKNKGTEWGRAERVERGIIETMEKMANPKDIAKVMADTAIPQEVKVVANVLRNRFSTMLTHEMRAGVPISHLGGNLGYFPRITNQEVTQYLKQAKVGNVRVWNKNLQNSVSRRTRDWTLAEANQFFATNGVPSLGGRAFENYFITNPAYAVGVRAQRSAKAITSREFINDTVKQFGKTKGADKFWISLSDDVLSRNPSLRGVKFDPIVADEVSRVYKNYWHPDINKFKRTFDAVQNTWKRWTLAPFPKYHMRNMVGNMWNNYLAGVNPKAYDKAQALQFYRKFKYSKGAPNQLALSNLKRLGITPEIADDIIAKGERLGVLGHGWYASDIADQRTADFLNPKGWRKIYTPHRQMIDKGMKIGTTIENNARLAHFVSKMDDGANAMTSAISTKKYLFDYQDLTAFEQQVMKRLFPFYTWTRKNIPLQFERLFKTPTKFAPLATSLRGRNIKDLARLKLVNPKMYDRLPIELRTSTDNVTYIPLEGVIPAGDLIKMHNPTELVWDLLSPYLRAPLELKFNKSLYNERELNSYDGETRELLRLDLPSRMKYLLTTVLPQARLISEVNKIVKRTQRGEELTPAEHILSQTLSSIYKTSLKDLKTGALGYIQKKARELESGAFKARVQGREEEFKRVMEQYKQIIKELDKVK